MNVSFRFRSYIFVATGIISFFPRLSFIGLMVMFLLLLFVVLCVTNGQDESLKFTCPSILGKLPPIRIAVKSIVTIDKTISIGSLCTLTLESENGLKVPVARSYDGNDWERAGGSFAAGNEDWVCNDRACWTHLPPGGMYILETRSTSMAVNIPAEVVRFLESASFGARSFDISAWGDKSFAEYVNEQVHVPMTLHREVFRQKANPRWTFHKPEFAAQLDPCAPNSTWRRHVLTTMDRDKLLSVRKIRDRWEVSIDGHIRTMVKQLRFLNAYKLQNDVITNGSSYVICSTEDQIRRGIYSVFVGSSCRPLVSDDLFVDFPDDFEPSVIVRGLLPPIESTTNWQKISDWRPEYMYLGYISTVAPAPSLRTPSASDWLRNMLRGGFFKFLIHLLCPWCETHTPTSPSTSTPSPSYMPSSSLPRQSCSIVSSPPSIGGSIFAKTSDGVWLQYDPRIKLEKNTLEEPLQDGGLNLLEEGKIKYCMNAARTIFNEGHCKMSNVPACIPGAVNTSLSRTGVIVCGSSGEVSNIVSRGDTWLDLASIDDSRSRDIGLPSDTTSTESFSHQREFIWSEISLNSDDQLRQRVAFALLHIFSLPKTSISGESRHTEIFLQYYDIFVRNAFGNYGDILKEITYSALNAESLSYIDSRSLSASLQVHNATVYPDENYSRELMQLFTIGLVKINMDGTPIMDANGFIQTYKNEDVQSFARVWTGFRRSSKRANVENPDSNNRIDPLRIDLDRRDIFPKSDLANGYIGDYYPLCTDIPDKAFLRIGAKYILLGTSAKPELRKESWIVTPNTQRLNLQRGSSLYQILCNPSSDESCSYPNVVVLKSNLPCEGMECIVDTVQVVQVGAIFYEYIRVPCVEQPFFSEGAKVTGVSRESKPICTNTLLPVAAEACCLSNTTQPSKKTAVPACVISAERMTRASAHSRCASVNRVLCDYVNVTASEKCPFVGFYWTSQSCMMRVKVTNDGQVAVVHDYATTSNELRKNSPNFFKVYWEGDIFPTVGTDCGGGECEKYYNDSCICNITVTNEPVFFTPPENAASILDQLRIGHGSPAMYDSIRFIVGEEKDYRFYSTTQNCCNQDTFYEFEDQYGRTIYLRNIKSTVNLVGTGFKFRNPPQFSSFLTTEQTFFSAQYEIEAALNHLLYHPNTAPFLAYRFIQRFGVSNPSPRYVFVVSSAFKTGTYFSGGVKFGAGRYGDLEAMIAAILLDREARSMVLDNDPVHGSLREPILKVIAFMRATGFNSSVPLVELGYMDIKVGQMAYEQATVFSFFRPDYSPSELSGTGLISPESEVMSSSAVVGLLNGLFSLVKFGLNECNGGFGVYGDCNNSKISGRLTHQPSSFDDLTKMVQDLSTLLTGGRMSNIRQQTIVNEIAKQPNATTSYQLALQLIASAPEFHSTNTMDSVAITGPPSETPVDTYPLQSGYKAVIHLALRGGCDSFNVLVPDSSCIPLHQEYVNVRGSIGLSQSQTIPLAGGVGEGMQPCERFTVHAALPIIQNLYNNGDLAFIANVGVLTQYVNKTNFSIRTKTPLFSHNSMQDEINSLDPDKKFVGTGTLGRMAKVLQEQGYVTGRAAIDSQTGNLAYQSTTAPTILTMNHNGASLFNIEPQSETMNDVVQQLNTGENGIYGNLWSSLITQSIDQTNELFEVLNNTIPSTVFPSTLLGKRMRIIAQLIAARESRGVERDFYFLTFEGFDTHSDVSLKLEEKFVELNRALDSFVTELKSIGVWNNIAIIQTSDFGRTLTENSVGGTDHGWGGNYWLTGGAVKGQQIVGKYPSTLNLDGEQSLERGRLIPSTPWDSVFNSIAHWVGAKFDHEIDFILPNRRKFTDLFSEDDLFNTK